ncbi:MAG: hypothetical protein JXB85_14325 [Anaerolineales bacterium]|nr:hypothetical protein [Anaerolineales bacterium]
MRKVKFALTLNLLLVFLLQACAPGTEFDIRGTWSYTLLFGDGVTYDAGMITFVGDPADGTCAEINIYQIDYEGSYHVRGVDVTIVINAVETWTGSFSDADHLGGTWEGPAGVSGTWTAARQP